MAIGFGDLKQVKSSAPQRIAIYGPPGLGKTTLASEFPTPVFIQTEDGAPSDVEIISFGHVQSFAGVMEAVVSLYTEEHKFQTLVLDSLSALEVLIHAELCARKSWSSIEDPGYGKGYKEADFIWQEFLEGVNALRRDRGMTIILVGHTNTDRFDDPTSASYSRYEIDLHDRAMKLIDRDMDAILLVKQEVTMLKEAQGFNKERTRAGGEARYIYATPNPAYTAKNRSGMPDRTLYQKGKGYAALAAFLPAPTAPAPADAQAAA